jgi:hypothetical protein
MEKERCDGEEEYVSKNAGKERENKEGKMRGNWENGREECEARQRRRAGVMNEMYRRKVVHECL